MITLLLFGCSTAQALNCEFFFSMISFPNKHCMLLCHKSISSKFSFFSILQRRAGILNVFWVRTLMTWWKSAAYGEYERRSREDTRWYLIQLCCNSGALKLAWHDKWESIFLEPEKGTVYHSSNWLNKEDCGYHFHRLSFSILYMFFLVRICSTWSCRKDLSQISTKNISAILYILKCWLQGKRW